MLDGWRWRENNEQDASHAEVVTENSVREQVLDRELKLLNFRNGSYFNKSKIQ